MPQIMSFSMVLILCFPLISLAALTKRTPVAGDNLRDKIISVLVKPVSQQESLASTDDCSNKCQSPSTPYGPRNCFFKQLMCRLRQKWSSKDPSQTLGNGSEKLVLSSSSSKEEYHDGKMVVPVPNPCSDQRLLACSGRECFDIAKFVNQLDIIG